MKKVIIDFDNTMGIKECDVDDAHALFYLLGDGNIEVLGATTTYGNSDIDTVYNNTKRIFTEMNIKIPCYKGLGKNENFLQNEAVDFLVESANIYKKKLTILATGSMTNLYGAYLKDNSFFEKVRVVLMGGITEPLVFDKKIMDELNLSCDAIATKTIIENANVSIITGNNCLVTTFTKEEFETRLFGDKAKEFYEASKYYFEYNSSVYGIVGFHNWDVVAACYLANPNLFEDNFVKVSSDIDNLKKGYLEKTNDGYLVNIPKIKDVEIFKNDIYMKWNNYFK